MNNVNDDHEMAGLREHREKMVSVPQTASERFITDYSTYCWNCDSQVRGDAALRTVFDKVEIEISCPDCYETLTDVYEWSEQTREKRS